MSSSSPCHVHPVQRGKSSPAAAGKPGEQGSPFISLGFHGKVSCSVPSSWDPSAPSTGPWQLPFGLGQVTAEVTAREGAVQPPLPRMGCSPRAQRAVGEMGMCSGLLAQHCRRDQCPAWVRTPRAQEIPQHSLQITPHPPSVQGEAMRATTAHFSQDQQPEAL